MDAADLRHLDAWIARHEYLTEDEQADLRARMIAVTDDDPTLANEGWTRVRDIAQERS